MDLEDIMIKVWFYKLEHLLEYLRKTFVLKIEICLIYGIGRCYGQNPVVTKLNLEDEQPDQNLENGEDWYQQASSRFIKENSSGKKKRKLYCYYHYYWCTLKLRNVSHPLGHL